MRSCFLALAVGIAVSGAGCARQARESEILAKVHPGHPRLLLNSDTLAAIKAGAASDPWLKKRHGQLRKQADELTAEPPAQYLLKGTDGLLDAGRLVLARTATLALAYRLDGDKKHLDRCWRELDAAARFPDWDSRHFLNTAELVTAFALAYDWLYDAWTPEQRAAIRGAIVNLGLRPGLAAYHSGRGWPTWPTNWNVHCNAALALGALAVADEDPAVAGEVLALGLASVPRSLAQFGPDGAWGEGPMYWGNATLFAALYLDSLQTACGTDFGLGEAPGLAQSGWFPVYVNGPAEGSFNFADAAADPEPRAGEQLFWLARRFREPRYASYEREYPNGRLAALELIWGAGVDHQPWQSIPCDRYFRGVEVATMRDRWDDPRSWFVGFKAGSNTVDHAHLDVGTFIFEAKGVRWAVDLGPDDYDLPGYSHDDGDEQRWSYYRLRAEGHNTLAIDPGSGPDQDHLGSGQITSFASSPAGAELTADLTGVYPSSRRVVRSLAFVRGRSLAVTDAIELRESGDVWWFLQTRARAQPSADGRSLELSQRGETMRVELISPATARFEVGPAEPLPTSPHPPAQAVNTGVTRIAVHLAGAKDATISVRFGE